MAPNVAPDREGMLLTWLEPAADHVEAPPSRLRMARFENGAWGPAVTIVERDSFFANWADVPGVARGGDGSLVAWWLQKSAPDTFAYHVCLARSTDDGATWTELGTAHPDDESPTEHGFVSAVATPRGVRLFWLDGRAMTSGAHGDGGHGGGEMGLRTATVDDGKVGPSVLLDSRVCECCGTSAAAADQGVIVAYRDRGPSEVRDISFAMGRDAGWSEPQPVHEDGWKINGCPVNGPAADVRAGQAAVAWYTGADNDPAVAVTFLAVTDDGAAEWTSPIRIDGSLALGRVDLVLDDAGDAIVCWMTLVGRDANVMLVRVRRDGTVGPRVTVATTSSGRSSGFPKVALVNGEATVTWTETGDTLRLRSAMIDLASLQ